MSFLCFCLREKLQFGATKDTTCCSRALKRIPQRSKNVKFMNGTRWKVDTAANVSIYAANFSLSCSSWQCLTTFFMSLTHFWLFPVFNFKEICRNWKTVFFDLRPLSVSFRKIYDFIRFHKSEWNLSSPKVDGHKKTIRMHAPIILCIWWKQKKRLWMSQTWHKTYKNIW